MLSLPLGFYSISCMVCRFVVVLLCGMPRGRVGSGPLRVSFRGGAWQLQRTQADHRRHNAYPCLRHYPPDWNYLLNFRISSNTKSIHERNYLREIIWSIIARTKPTSPLIHRPPCMCIKNLSKRFPKYPKKNIHTKQIEDMTSHTNTYERERERESEALRFLDFLSLTFVESKKYKILTCTQFFLKYPN